VQLGRGNQSDFDDFTKPMLNRPSSAQSSMSASITNTGPISIDLLASVWPEFKSTPRPPPTVANLVQHCRAKREPDRGLLTKLEYDVAQAMQVVGASKQVVLQTGFEASAAGKPVDTSKPGATNGSMELIFRYYAARQSVGSTGVNSDPTFEDIEHANTTISAGEFIKFMEDMVMFMIPRNDVFNVFQPRSAEKKSAPLDSKQEPNDSDHGASQELDFSDFLAAVVRLSIYIFKTSDKVSYQACVEQMAEMLHASDSHHVKEYLTMAGRVNAGFGAWKMAPEEAVAFKKSRKPRIRQTIPMSSLIPGPAVIAELCNFLLSFSGKVYNVTWHPFSGPYIAMVIPTQAIAKRCRLQIVLRNMSPTHFIVDREIFGVPCLQIKSMPPKKIAAGMDFSMELWVDSPGCPCEHLGGVNIFEGEDRKFLFTIPIYIKIVATSSTTVEDEITLELSTKHKEKEVIIQNMCRVEDTKLTGELPKEVFLQILSKCGMLLPKVKLNFMVWRIRSSDANINYEDFFSIFYSSSKQKNGPNGGVLSQLFGPDIAIRLCKGYCCSHTPKVVEAHLLARALSRSSKGLQLSESAWASGCTTGDKQY
jgi:Ca2+-binding EF-hand superfamily protein